MSGIAHEILVCVGGPADGHRVTVRRNEQFYRFHDSEKIPAMPFGASFVPERVNFQITDYQRVMWIADGHRMAILAPRGQSLTDTMRTLIDGYRQPQEPAR